MYQSKGLILVYSDSLNKITNTDGVLDIIRHSPSHDRILCICAKKEEEEKATNLLKEIEDQLFTENIPIKYDLLVLPQVYTNKTRSRIESIVLSYILGWFRSWNIDVLNTILILTSENLKLQQFIKSKLPIRTKELATDSKQE